jgi:hypothetical protein
MGMFDDFSNFLTHGAKEVGNFLKHGEKKLEKGLSTGYNDFKELLSGIDKDVNKVLDNSAKLGSQAIREGGEIVKGGEDMFGKAAWPLAIGAAILGGAILLKK